MVGEALLEVVGDGLVYVGFCDVVGCGVVWGDGFVVFDDVVVDADVEGLEGGVFPAGGAVFDFGVEVDEGVIFEEVGEGLGVEFEGSCEGFVLVVRCPGVVVEDEVVLVVLFGEFGGEDDAAYGGEVWGTVVGVVVEG